MSEELDGGVGDGLATPDEGPRAAFTLAVDSQARALAVGVHEHDIRRMDEAFLLDDAALPSALPAGLQVALLQAHLLHPDAIALRIHGDYSPLLAPVCARDNLNQVTFLDPLHTASKEAVGIPE
jgi:hypothetical protein